MGARRPCKEVETGIRAASTDTSFKKHFRAAPCGAQALKPLLRHASASAGSCLSPTAMTAFQGFSGVSASGRSVSESWEGDRGGSVKSGFVCPILGELVLLDTASEAFTDDFLLFAIESGVLSEIALLSSQSRSVVESAANGISNRRQISSFSHLYCP
jgi:hypothetical protein